MSVREGGRGKKRQRAVPRSLVSLLTLCCTLQSPYAQLLAASTLTKAISKQACGLTLPDRVNIRASGHCGGWGGGRGGGGGI
jgi:hypothetical protein